MEDGLVGAEGAKGPGKVTVRPEEGRSGLRATQDRVHATWQIQPHRSRRSREISSEDLAGPTASTPSPLYPCFSRNICAS